MAAKYLFRMDDITWDMNYDRFKLWRDMFKEEGISPLIGVIPKNKDEKLKKYATLSSSSISEKEFWDEIKVLVNDYKWVVALHGINHVYFNDDAGIFGINHRSEFAGRSIDEQTQMVDEGLRILNDHGLDVNIFMAPAHSLDDNTIKAISNCEINNVTDGDTFFPFFIDDVYFIPQLWSFPKRNILGVSTFCIHPNTTLPSNIEKYRKFIRNNKKYCVSWDDVLYTYKNLYKKKKYHIYNLLLKPIVMIEKAGIKIIAKSKRLIRGDCK